MKSILITGCSSGIGYDAAFGLKEAGLRVFASCRSKKDCHRLSNLGFETVQLDYSNTSSINSAIDEVLGFHKITKFNLFPGWHQVSTSTHFMINLDLWKKMGAADQALFEMACTAAAMRAITTGEFLQGKQIQSFPGKGVTAARLPDSVLRELQKVSARVMKEESAKDADFAKVWASQQAFMKEYDVWQKWGYLPRNF